MTKFNKKFLAVSILAIAPLCVPHLVLASENAPAMNASQNGIYQGEILRDSGHLLDAQKQFDLAIKESGTTEAYLIALTASGYNQFLLNNVDLAEKQLKDAYVGSTKSNPYIHAMAGQYLATLYLSEGADDNALRYLNEAIGLAKAVNHPELVASALLLKANLEDTPDVSAIADAIAGLPEGYVKARLQLQWAEYILDFYKYIDARAEQQAWAEKAFVAMSDAQQVADGQKNIRFQTEVLVALTKLYYLQQRYDDALLLADRGLMLASHFKADELVVKLNQLKGDCFKRQGNKLSAFKAYALAMDTLALIKDELPINLPNGQSVVDALIDPVYRSYADLFMQTAEANKSASAQDKLMTVLNSMEAVKKADLQDFFLSRCSAALEHHTDWTKQTFPGAAVLYPIIFDDRIELVLKHDALMTRRTVKITAEQLNEQVNALVSALRNGQSYKASASKLYQWLYAPIQKDLQQLNNPTLVFVPDRSVRGMPLAALYDGKHFVAEKNAVVTLPSLDLENVYRPKMTHAHKQTLIAGISKPDGTSIDDLPKYVAHSLGAEGDVPGRGMSKAASRSGRSKLVDELSLPGVEKEVAELQTITHSQPMLNKAFTTDVFKANLESAQYSNVHIASHGFFGKNIKDSFVMAYDHNLTLQDFETSLKNDNLKQNPIELLTLSACQTAEGNDRMLLGFTGLAVKSNALSAVGSLWPVSDKGTVQFMKNLYKGLNNALPRSQAMQQAQIAMIKSKEFHHPYYWSPFVLVGNWQ